MQLQDLIHYILLLFLYLIIFHSLKSTKSALLYAFKDLRHHGRSCQSEVGGHVPAVYQCIQGQRSGPTKYPESLGKCGSYAVKGEKEHQRNPLKVRDDCKEFSYISLYMYKYCRYLHVYVFCTLCQLIFPLITNV